MSKEIDNMLCIHAIDGQRTYAKLNEKFYILHLFKVNKNQFIEYLQAI